VATSAKRPAWIDALSFLKFDRLEESLSESVISVIKRLHELLEERPVEVP
jgi:hypothetical protein